MEEKIAPQPVKGEKEAPAYSTFLHTATHGASDKRCYQGKLKDWERNQVKRTFGGKGN